MSMMFLKVGHELPAGRWSGAQRAPVPSMIGPNRVRYV